MSAEIDGEDGRWKMYMSEYDTESMIRRLLGETSEMAKHEHLHGTTNLECEQDAWRIWKGTRRLG